ncbi:MAG TPA: MMPL family transporter, partial [Pseudomonadota bacterium]|nr:MMPL family transporter [Pseudomonadota bacterium]
MAETQSSPLATVFRTVVRFRWLVVALYALLMGPAVYLAIQVPQDNAPDRLILESDDDYRATRAFEQVFGSAEYVILWAEADDPFSPEVLRRLLDLEASLSKLDRISTNSALGIFRRAKAGFEPTPETAAAFKKFALGSDIFRRQGLVGEHHLSIPVVLANQGANDRRLLLDKVDAVLAPLEKNPAPLLRLRKVGQSYVHAYLDRDTRETGMRYFPLFFLFVIGLNVALYRSWRALLAFIITLGVSAAMTVGFVGLTGGVFTIVSQVVPMTILITCTATLVYLHSRFVDQPEGTSVDDHQIFALCNKFLACTASIFAAAVGFAALAVSKIRPVREMGLWVAVGLFLTWLTVFTLFPALQKILKTPTQRERPIGAGWYLRLVHFLPRFTYRYRWLLVLGSLTMSAAGAVALFGLQPAGIKPMYLQTNPVEYIPHDSALYKDTKELGKQLGGLSVTTLWLRPTPEAQAAKRTLGAVSKAELLRALDDLHSTIDKMSGVGSVTSLVTILRTLRYVAGKSDQLPTDSEALEKISDD